jgi:hypothetical protein
VTVLGIDYAWTKPDPAAIAAAGYTFACRYLSRDATKNLTPAEAQSLAAHGIWVVSNWEYGAQDMLRGYAGGVADAQLALEQAAAAGMPSGRPIYFSADWDVTPAQEAAVLAYLAGADSVLGWSQAGEYGGYYPLKTALDAGATQWAWQTLAWSGGQWDGRATIRQTGSATIGGVQVDVNQAMAADYGQWMPGRLPNPAVVAAASREWRNEMHIDLEQGAARVVTPPAAVLGGGCTLTLANDFGTAQVRVAIFSFSAKGWNSIKTYTVASTDGATSIPLTADANKLSLVFESGTGVVGADLY